ncbi:MAG: hypothetical protein J7K26_03660 [Candidatus Aenigmarchaeota archaeon]|nr:hypothetical protein [Candidatus Aenigmarchaeota archaeon]
MPKLKMKIDALTPQHVKIIKYKGPNPSAILTIAPNILKSILKLSSTSLFTDQIKWDTSSKIISFYGQWRGKDGKDKYTKVWFKIIAQGKIDENNNGELTVWLTSEIDVGFEYKYPIEKFLLWIYKKFLYSEQLKRYAKEGRRNADQIEREIKNYFGIGG